MLDRFGSPNGDFLSPLRPDGQAYGFGERAIMPDSLGKGYHVYVLDAPLTVELAQVAPAFDQNGGARQLQPVFDAALIDPATGKMSVQRLSELGLLHEVTAAGHGRVLPPDFGTFDADGNVRTPDPVTVADAQNGAFDNYTPTYPPASLTPTPSPRPRRPPRDRSRSARRPSASTRRSAGSHGHCRLWASRCTPRTGCAHLSSRIPANDGHAVRDIHTDGDGVRIGDTHYTRDSSLVQLIANHPDLAGKPIMFVGC